MEPDRGLCGNHKPNDSLNRRKTLSESLALARLLFCNKGDDVYGKQ